MVRVWLRAVAIVLVPALMLMAVSAAVADSAETPNMSASPYDVIQAVNVIRISYGLPPYTISPILMAAAQNHADYMAATGNVSHSGAGGSSVTDRLLAAGYPLAGDLSLGGFRSENITAGNENISAEAAVKQWTGDSLHLTTMISPSLSEIGAGVSVNDGKAYFVIDCAQPQDALPSAPVDGTAVTNPSIPPAASGGVMIPVVVSTPNAEGNLLHEVKAGQTLWQIAISYNTTIDEIKRLNYLVDDNIYPGMKLLIQQGATPAATFPVELVTTAATNSTIVSPDAIIITPTGTLIPMNELIPDSSRSILRILIAILAAAVLGGGMVALMGNPKK